MRKRNVLEQHIAVFGESGSGKTVMVSSFYGAAQEPQNIKTSGFNVVAENPTHNSQLLQNYLGMKNSSKLPAANKFSSTSFAFRIHVKNIPGVKREKAGQLDALSLVWHDYPGEWFEQNVSGPTEAQRRLETFRALLSSDVALLLVDSQKLLDNAGEEERYLKSLLTNYRNGLLSLKNELLDDGKGLVTFPRIWILALSKSDLVPSMNVTDFRDLVLEKAGADVDELREALSKFVESSEALSVGEDFVLLSSAKFNANKIEVAERVGLDLILPIAAVLPLERHIRWAQMGQVSRQVASYLLIGVGTLAGALGLVGGLATKFKSGKGKLVGIAGLLLSQFGPNLKSVVKKGELKLKDLDTVALARKNSLAATLARFHTDLDKAEEEQILLRSLR